MVEYGAGTVPGTDGVEYRPRVAVMIVSIAGEYDQ